MSLSMCLAVEIVCTCVYAIDVGNLIIIKYIPCTGKWRADIGYYYQHGCKEERKSGVRCSC